MSVLDRVTITGADDSLSPNNLLLLSREFPFVEWGILASESNRGGAPRFPSLRWVEDLRGLQETSGAMKLSLHLCGRWVRQLLVGEVDFPREIVNLFQRVQLNFHAEKSTCFAAPFMSALDSFEGRDFIFQIDGAGGNRHLEAVYDFHANNCYPLFDISGGAGILPTEWPAPVYPDDDGGYVYHGYAGGLGPENLAAQIPLIMKAAGNARIWIDMETRVRSNNDQRFDLHKVRQCLEIAAPFVSSEVTA